MASKSKNSKSPTQILVNILTSQSRCHKPFETKELWIQWVHEQTNFATKPDYQIARIDSYSVDENVVYFFVEHNIILSITHIAQILERLMPGSGPPKLISKSVHLHDVLTNDGADQPQSSKAASTSKTQIFVSLDMQNSDWVIRYSSTLTAKIEGAWFNKISERVLDIKSFSAGEENFPFLSKFEHPAVDEFTDELDAVIKSLLCLSHTQRLTVAASLNVGANNVIAIDDMRQRIGNTVDTAVRSKLRSRFGEAWGKSVKVGDLDDLVDYVGSSLDASKQEILKAKKSILGAFLVGFKGWPKDPHIKEMGDKSSGNPTTATQDAPHPTTPAKNLANQDALAEDPAIGDNKSPKNNPMEESWADVFPSSKLSLTYR